MITRDALPYPAHSAEYFIRLRDLGDAVWLDSCQPDAVSGRFDILSAAPVEQLCWRHGDPQDPFDALNRLLERHQDHSTPPCDEIPFCGGAIGHFSYDLGRTQETLPTLALDDMRFPEMRVGIYSWAVIIDHAQQRCELVCQHSVSADTRSALLRQLQTTQTHTPVPFRLTHPFTSNTSAQAYAEKLQRIDDYIHAGDCYQVNFAQRFSSQFQGDPLDAYLKLRQQAPTPFAALLESTEGTILSLSPERFLAVDNAEVSTKPIKGTRPVKADPVANQAEIDDLLSSSKDRAENLMIVDLLRNDLSKTCALGSVKVPSLFALESYANVHHLVSTVTGTLDEGYTPVDLLRSCFPGGSITGAPKLRAMEIIEELEPHRRSVYCGSIGYISFCGKMDTSITIRTLLAKAGEIHCWAGGGIVADSDIDAEYQETFNKVNNLLHCLESTLECNTPNS